jgi:hypothetical protein
MDQSRTKLLLIAFVTLLALSVTAASLIILSGGKLYHKIPDKSRPRRWFVGSFFAYFLTFCVWFPVWSVFPHSTASNALTFIFGAFTAFIAAWYALGKVATILLPLIALGERAVGAYRERSGARRR